MVKQWKSISENGHTPSYDVADNKLVDFSTGGVDVDEADVAANELSDYYSYLMKIYKGKLCQPTNSFIFFWAGPFCHSCLPNPNQN